MAELSVLTQSGRVKYKMSCTHKLPKGYVLREEELLSWRETFGPNPERGSLEHQSEFGQATAYLKFEADGSGIVRVESASAEDLFPAVKKALRIAKCTVNYRRKIHVCWSPNEGAKTAMELEESNKKFFSEYTGKIELNPPLPLKLLDRAGRIQEYNLSYESDDFKDLLNFALELYLIIEADIDQEYSEGIKFMLEEEDGTSAESELLLRIIQNLLNREFDYIRRKIKRATLSRPMKREIRRKLRNEVSLVCIRILRD